jgi:hypothetical protein
VFLAKNLGQLFVEKLYHWGRSDMKHFMERVLLGVAAIGFCGILILGLTTNVRAEVAPVVTLEHANSVVTIDPTSQAGMLSWVVDQKNYDAQQWFWYRIGETDMEHSIDTIAAPSIYQFDADGDGIVNGVRLTYSRNDIDVIVSLTLMGGDAGSGWSDISEQISVKNKTATTMPLHFFQYNNFDLSVNNDYVNFATNNRVLQHGGPFQLSEEWGDGTPPEGEVVVTGSPTHEAGVFDALLQKLNNAVADDLSGNSTAGPANVDWGFEWSVNLPRNGMVIISKDKLLNVPEPSTLVLLSIFGACIAFATLRGKK